MAAVPKPEDFDAGKADADRIGHDGEILRAFNFSGGGFNTVMQLGVTHALLVTQGRAPDVVVGVSAGSIQATALAEVMRKGNVPEKPIKPAYERVLNERVACFRRVIDACHRAPADLVDALLPDAYQIESFDPLAPLGQPTLDHDERVERSHWLATKAGLARLYNELLGLDIPIGVIAHLVRRFLGFRAVGNIGRDNALGWLWRSIARVGEVLKLLLLISEHLARFAPLVRLLVAPMLDTLYGTGRTRAQSDAESIMSRFGVLERLKRFRGSLGSFVLVLNIWLAVSLLIVLPFVVISVQGAVDELEVSRTWLTIALVEVALIFSPLLPAAVRGGFEDARRVLANTAKGVIVFLWNSAKWFLVTLVLTAVPVALLAMLARSGLITDSRDDLLSYLAVPGIVAMVFWVAAVAKYVWMLLFRASGMRGFLRNLSRACVRLCAAGLAWVVAVAVTLGVDEVLPWVLDLLHAPHVLDQLLALASPPLTIGQMEDGARSGMLTWSQRGVLDALIAIMVVGTSLVVSVAVVLIGLVWIGGSFLCRADSKTGFYGWFFRRFLNRYKIGASIADGYPLKRFLVSMFDPAYYGTPNLVEAADAALSNSRAALPMAGRQKARTRIEDYARAEHNRPPIRLALAVADVKSGKLDVIPQHHGIIDALMAATAFPPVFPAVKLGDCLYADAINVGNVPTRALLRLLRRNGTANIPAVHVYSVDPLPITQEKLSPPIDADGKQKSTPYLNLIDTASRALQLQRFRDAKVERRLTNIFTGLLPQGVGTLTIPHQGKTKTFFRAFIAPVELDRPIDLNAQILYAPKETRRAELAETIAMGCRAALQVMLAETLASPAAKAVAHGKQGARFISCDKAVELYKTHNGGHSEIHMPGKATDAPGLAEVCKYCRIKNEHGRVVAHQGVKAVRSLRILDPEDLKEITDWPQELQWAEPRPPDQSAQANVPAPTPMPVPPEPPTTATAPIEPAAACLFGGGVFRGVFQMGVLGALAMAKFKPTVVAGASVGSITAAMAAVVLDETDEARQRQAIAELASVFLSIDRLVLTDRFADFVRTWTIRASEARFSVREADRVFRKYDFDAAPVFQRTFRAVVAGLERLFYVNPYQLNEIVSDARHRRVSRLVERLKDSAQAWLDRMNVGTEVLGAEPLRQLIEQFVVAKIAHSELQGVTLKSLSSRSHLIATTTNLTQGTLRVLGSKQDGHVNPATITLIETLLASSAFPGVFRPRRSCDLLPGDSAEDEYVDGGIVDNLPLDPVLQELRALADAKSLDLRPEHPHLLVAASLEPRYEQISNEDAAALAGYWPDLRTRLRELQYNVKLDMYRFGLDDVTAVYDHVLKQGQMSPRVPLSVKLIAVQPEWLCSTFAFHPMLGFRHTHQAKSIAHGCASTLGALAEVRSGAREKWHLDEGAIPAHSLADALKQRKLPGSLRAAGKCWMLPDKTCPFSAAAVKKSDLKDSAHWVAEIHRHCWDKKTHTREALS